jgi:hypothetical protein
MVKNSIVRVAMVIRVSSIMIYTTINRGIMVITSVIRVIMINSIIIGVVRL